MRVCGSLLALAGVCLFVYGVFDCWICRDGLGPDSVTSSGWLALARFMKGFWLVPCVSLPLCAVGAYLWLRSA